MFDYAEQAHALSLMVFIMASLSRTGGVFMMNRLQSLFNRLAGIATLEVEMRSRAHAIYCVRESMDALETPACWRRKSRVGCAQH